MITNLVLHQGSYATTGKPVLALVDSGSFYVEGYFEETKLPRIHIGDAVRVIPMGGQRSLYRQGGEYCRRYRRARSHHL
ncbi:hypothetical protein [Sodalis praecaptivus]|uniref:hypothetical protein n=1 Tax=Sodalis praecaptivus TaxID=1239307 RepID=UPI0027F0127F|nr:hypothetical protein [Sodalis praecaptivus]CAJ0994069.1 p-hydroxybenzoic acid efflux pump subunit AaeA [Sodalis praecaptivus]